MLHTTRSNANRHTKDRTSADKTIIAINTHAYTLRMLCCAYLIYIMYIFMFAYCVYACGRVYTDSTNDVSSGCVAILLCDHARVHRNSSTVPQLHIPTHTATHTHNINYNHIFCLCRHCYANKMRSRRRPDKLNNKNR